MEQFLACLGVVLGGVAIWFTWYGIRDVRREVKRMLTIERDRIYVKLRSDIAWLFLEPTGERHKKQAADLNEEFILLARNLDPKVSAEAWMDFINNEALSHANNLVKNGYARYPAGWHPEAIKKSLKQWEQEKAVDRFAVGLLGEKKNWFKRMFGKD